MLGQVVRWFVSVYPARKIDLVEACSYGFGEGRVFFVEDFPADDHLSQGHVQELQVLDEVRDVVSFPAGGSVVRARVLALLPVGCFLVRIVQLVPLAVFHLLVYGHFLHLCCLLSTLAGRAISWRGGMGLSCQPGTGGSGSESRRGRSR